jgi:hypothetical protein
MLEVCRDSAATISAFSCCCCYIPAAATITRRGERKETTARMTRAATAVPYRFAASDMEMNENHTSPSFFSRDA